MLMMNMGNGYYIDVSQVKMVGSLAGSSKVLPRLMDVTKAKGDEWVIDTTRGKKRLSMILMKDGSIFLSHKAAKTVIKNMYIAMMNHLTTTMNDVSFQPIDQAFYNVMLKMTLDVYSDIKTEAQLQQRRSAKIYSMEPPYQEDARNHRDKLHPDFAEEVSMEEIMKKVSERFDGNIEEALKDKKSLWDEEDDEEDDIDEEEDDDMDDEEEEDDE